MERVKIPPEATSLSIEGWDMDNRQQQAYIRAVNRHLMKTVDTDKDEGKKNHGIIGCGIYYPWVTQTDQWAEALQKAEAATKYRASWRWIMDSGDPAEPGEKVPKPEGWYDKIAEPYQKKYLKQISEANAICAEIRAKIARKGTIGSGTRAEV